MIETSTGHCWKRVFTHIPREASGRDVRKHGAIGVCASKSGGFDGGAHSGIGGPFGAVSIDHFALDDAGPQCPLTDVVGSIALAGKSENVSN